MCTFVFVCIERARGVVYRIIGSSNSEGSIESKSIERLMSTGPRDIKIDGFRRFSCRQLSHLPSGVLTRPLQPRG